MNPTKRIMLLPSFAWRTHVAGKDRCAAGARAPHASIEIETRRLNAERPGSTHPRSLTVVPRMTGYGADLPLRGRSTNAEDCLLA
jgi:hypothetical protein